jgi:hypothetical protein
MRRNFVVGTLREETTCVRSRLRWEDNSIKDKLDEAEFEVTDGTGTTCCTIGFRKRCEISRLVCRLLTFPEKIFLREIS